MNIVGVAVSVAGCLVACFLFFYPGGGLELVSSKLAPSQPAASLALVRVLMPFVLLLFSVQGKAMILRGKGLPFPWLRVVPGAASFLLLLGFQSQLSCMVLATFAMLTMGTHTFWHHNWNCIVMLLSILAFTPCGSHYSLDSIISRFQEEKHADKQGTKGVKAQDAIDERSDEESRDMHVDETPKLESNWAKTLILLHVSLIYFWAGCDKFHIGWMNGSALRKVILTRSSVAHLFTYVLPRPEVQLLVCSMVTLGCILAELLLPFLLWSKAYNIYGVAIGCLMHFSMSIFCGSLGAYTMVSWVMLAATLDDGFMNRFLRDPRNFAIVTLGALLVMTWTAQIEHMSPGRRMTLFL